MATHTYVELPVSASCYDEIKRLLMEAGYDHAFDGDAIDMHGIGLTRIPNVSGADYIVGMVEPPYERLEGGAFADFLRA